jgi:hypothetical protein
MNWNTLIDDVVKRGFANASSIARLVWSCEVGNGIDQHAAPDLKIILAKLNDADELADKAAKFINEEVMGDGASNKTFRELDASLLKYRKAAK